MASLRFLDLPNTNAEGVALGVERGLLTAKNPHDQMEKFVESLHGI